MNTLRVENDNQIAIGYASVASSPIFAGDYTMQQVKWVMTFRNALYRGEYTGEEDRRMALEKGMNGFLSFTVFFFAN